MALADDRCIRPAPRLSTSGSLRANPIDAFVRISVAEGYDHERDAPNELHIDLRGHFCDYDLSLSWSPADETLSLFILFEGRVPGGRSDAICRLLSLLNERLSVGHFDYWARNGGLVYRHSVSLKGGASISTDQALDLMSHAMDAAEQGYPAVQYVVWAGRSPEDALAEALVDLGARH